MRGMTWYSMHGSWLAEFWTLLHIPYTLMAICFVLAGFALRGPVDWTVALPICTAYFLGLGIAAHSLDQLPGMGTSYVKYITPHHLRVLASISLGAAIGIGGLMIVWKGMFILIPVMAVQIFFAFAYPMSKLFKGRFHTDAWFAVGFGLVPFFVGYLISPNMPEITTWVQWVSIALAGMVCCWISHIEILLSRFVRKQRSTRAIETMHVSGWQRAETALKILCLVVYAGTIFLLLRG